MKFEIKKYDSIFINIQNSETLGYKSDKICIGSTEKNYKTLMKEIKKR